MAHIHNYVKRGAALALCLIFSMTWQLTAHAQVEMDQFDRQEAQIIELYLAGDLTNPTIEQREIIGRFENTRANTISRPFSHPTLPAAPLQSEEEIIAYWNFNTFDPSTDTNLPADFTSNGAASISLDDWGGGVANFAGTTENAQFDDPSGASLSLQGGDELAGNGTYIQMSFSMTNYEALVLSFATRGTGTGFDSGQWSYSTDGTSFTDFGGNTSSNSSTWAVRTLETTALDGAETAYLRYTLDGATSDSGNNRIDNLVLSATPADGNGNGGGIFLSEDFEGGLPDGWQNVDETASGFDWSFDTFRGGAEPPMSGNVAFIDSDAAQSGNHVHGSLVTSAISIDGAENVRLSFDQVYRHSGSSATVHVSLNGNDWTEVITYTSTQGAWSGFGASTVLEPVTADLDLSSFVGGENEFYLRFEYNDDNNWAWYWAIDNVTVYEPAADPNPAVLVSPANEAEGVDRLATLEWTAGSGAEPDEYHVYFGTSPDPAFAGTVTETSWDTPELDWSTTYYWYVVAENEAGAADPSATWSFTTMDDPTLTPPFTVDFSDFPPENWERLYGELTDDTEFIDSPTFTNWVGGNFNNDVENDPATRINLWVSGDTPIYRWFMSPVIDMGDGSGMYELLFDVAVTEWNNSNPAQLGPEDYFAVVVSLDGGATWSSSDVMFDLSGADGDEVEAGGESVLIPLDGVSGEVKVAFYAERISGTTPDLHLHVGGVRIREVADVPVLVVDTDEIDFGTEFTGGAVDMTFSVLNDGVGSMTVSADSDSPEFLIDDSPVTIEAGESYEYTATFAPGSTGEHSGTLTLTADGASGSPATISVNGVAVDPPVIGIDPESFTVNATRSEPDVTRTLTISNDGGADLEFMLALEMDEEFVPDTYVANKQSSSREIAEMFGLVKGEAPRDQLIAFGERSRTPGLQSDPTHSMEIDISGQESPSYACSSDPDGRPSFQVDIGTGGSMTGVAWDVLLETNEESWASEAAIAFGSTSVRSQITLRPGAADGEPTPPGGTQYAGGPIDFTDNDLPDIEVDEDGLLWVSFCETFNDNADPDAFYLDPSMIEIFYIEGFSLITLSEAAGTVAPGESMDITLTFNTDVEPDTYLANLFVMSTDPDNEIIEVPITYTVDGPVEVANIAELFAIGEPGDGVIYTITGEVFLTFNSTFRNRKVVVDETRGMVLDDNDRRLNQDFDRYDGITGLTGTLGEFRGLIQFQPTMDMEASSEDNDVIPVPVNISDVTNDLQGHLVVIEDVTFQESGTFANSTNYTIEDALGNTLTMRSDRINDSIFDDGETNYVGTDIPTGPVTVVGYIGVFDDPQLVIRKLEDFIDPQAITSFDLLTPPNQAEVEVWSGMDDVVITWAGAQSVDELEYVWFATLPELQMMVPAVWSYSDDDGASPSLTVPTDDLLELLAEYDVTDTGESLTLKWSVVATTDDAFKHANQIFEVTFVVGEEPEPVGENVTFSVNMNHQMDEGVFMPGVGDEVFVRGSFNDWSTVEGQELEDDGTGVFTVTLFIEGEEDDVHEYKYYISAGDGRDLPNTGWEESVGPGTDNRQLVLTGEDHELDTVWFNNQEGVNLEPGDEIPMDFALKQNYPNPFNPTTQIQYELPEATDVRIDVFNVMGQRVATLVSGPQNAGYHTATFDANRLASGVYIYRMQAGSFVQTQKMLLVK